MAATATPFNVMHARLRVVIGGPTASGKSALALALAECFGGTVINADSQQVYRELSVLSARPDAAALARAPHALYGFLPAAERCSAGRWRAAALQAIAESEAAGRLPVLVGGTGLYLRALLDGLGEVPAIPEAVRHAVEALHQAGGRAALRRELERRDPEMAARLAPSDSQRTRRALEVVMATGRSLAAFQRPAGASALGGHVIRIVLEPPRAALRAACDARFRAMVEAGALEEVRALHALGLDPSLPAMKAVGVRELGRYLAGKASLADAIAAAQSATRRYAKRQQTWFRHQLPDAELRLLNPSVGEDFARIEALVADAARD
jgi:tRNA dimethylallyltransferase